MTPAAMDQKLSVIIITRNESHNLPDCIRSVAFADEIIVVDSSSTDGTQQIARDMGAILVETMQWPGFGPQKNLAMSKARFEWVLSIDADERVTPQLQAEILSSLPHPQTVVFFGALHSPQWLVPGPCAAALQKGCRSVLGQRCSRKVHPQDRLPSGKTSSPPDPLQLHERFGLPAQARALLQRSGRIGARQQQVKQLASIHRACLLGVFQKLCPAPGLYGRSGGAHGGHLQRRIHVPQIPENHAATEKSGKLKPLRPQSSVYFQIFLSHAGRVVLQDKSFCQFYPGLRLFWLF